MGEKRLSNYMTIEQASEYLNMPARTLRRRVEERVLKAYKPSKRIMFLKDDLDLFMKRFTV